MDAPGTRIAELPFESPREAADIHAWKQPLPVSAQVEDLEARLYPQAGEGYKIRIHSFISQ